MGHIPSNNSGTYHCNKSWDQHIPGIYRYPGNISLGHIPRKHTGTYPWNTSLQIILGHITATNPWDPHIPGIYRYPWDISLQLYFPCSPTSILYSHLRDFITNMCDMHSSVKFSTAQVHVRLKVFD